MTKRTARLMSILSVTALLGAMLSGVLVARSGSTAEAATVSVTANAPAEVMKGSEFSVGIDVTNVTNFDAGQFDVSFNSAMMELQGVDPGLIDATQIPVSIWNPIGSGKCRVVVNVPGVPGVSGSGYLAVLKFRATSSRVGAGALSLSNGFLNNNQGTEITATWSGDAVNVCEELVISTTSLSHIVVGSACSLSLTATGGDGSYTWSVSSGSLPNGLDLSAAGTISGTPTMVGEFTFTVVVADGGLSTSKVLTLTVIPRLGDVNDDGVVNSADITMTERIIVGLEVPTLGADANRDGVVNSADITKIERVIAGLS